MCDVVPTNDLHSSYQIAGILIAADMLMLPCAVFYSGDDKFIEEDVYKEFLHLMGISADREMVVGEDGKICVPGEIFQTKCYTSIICLSNMRIET